MQTAQLMTLFQNMMAQQKTSFTKPSDSKNEDSFSDLVQQKKDQISSDQTEKPADEVQKPQDTNQQAPTQEDEPAVSERDLLAASIAAQMVQIVPAQVQTPVAQQPIAAAPVVQAAPIMTETVQAQTAAAMQTDDVQMPKPQQQTAVQQPAQTETPAFKQPEQAQPQPQSVQTTADEPPMASRVAQAQQTPVENTANKDEIAPEKVAPQAEQPVFQIKDAVPVKVGEAQSTVDAEAPDLDAKLAVRIEQGLKSVGDKIEIRLTPENLGTITVEMTAKGGQIGLVIHTETAKTATLISQHASSLGAMVETRTGETVNIQVQQQQPQQHSYDGHNRQEQPQEQPQHGRQQDGKQREDDFAQQLRLGLFSVQTAS